MTEIDDSNIIWFPGVYHGNLDEEYQQEALYLPIEQVIELVQKRAKHDGEWCIANGRVGKDNANEPKMRSMMEFVSDEKHIRQAVEYIQNGNAPSDSTVDYVCRDLANASHWAESAKKAKKDQHG